MLYGAVTARRFAGDHGMARPDLLLARVDAPSPLGPLLLVSDGRCLVALDFGAPGDRLLRLLRARFGPDVALAEAEDPQGFAAALSAYVAGRLDALDLLPADGGGSTF